MCGNRDKKAYTNCEQTGLTDLTIYAILFFMIKICTDCHTEKPLDDFNKGKAYKDGHKPFCRDCHKLRNAKAREQFTPEQRSASAARAKAFRETNPDKIKEYKEKNRNKHASRMKDRYNNDAEYRDKILAWQREWGKNNPEKIRESNKKQYAKRPIDERRKYHREYTATRRATDPEWKAKSYERRNISRHKRWDLEGNTKSGYVKKTEDKLIDQSVIARLHAWQADYCYFCNSPMEKVTIEHILPRARGGRSSTQNLALTCESCNYSRQKSIYNLEWLPKSVMPVEDKIFLKQQTIRQTLAKENIHAVYNGNGSWTLASIEGKSRIFCIISTFFGSDRNPASQKGKMAKWAQTTFDQPIILFDHEWYNRRASCINMLKSKLGIALRAPGARKLDIIDVNAEQAKMFLNTHHVMGNVIAPIRIGLTDGETLFGLGEFHDKEDTWECDRLAFHGHVPGGMSKIMKALWSFYGVKPIRTFVDSRYADGGGHETIGFEHIGYSPESFQWVYPDRVQHQRYLSNENKMASNLLYYNEEYTREDNIRANGIFKIWTPKRHIVVWKP